MNNLNVHVFTQAEKNQIDELAMHYAEGSRDFMSLSYAIQAVVRERLLIIELRNEKEAMHRRETGLEANPEVL